MPPEILTPATLARAGFVRVSRSAMSGQVVELYVSAGDGCTLAALTFGSTNHWRASGLDILRQQWRWLRLMWWPSRRIRKGTK